jgi:hypothetical protein
MTAETRDDLVLQALCYAADALDADAAAAFERRLDGDQELREALAEAVRVLGAVSQVEASNRRRRRFATVGLALAACLGLIGAPRLLAPSHRRAETASAVEPAQAVALAWSGLRQEVETSNGLITSLDEPVHPAVDPEEAVDTLPRWLLEAAALPAADDGQGS